MAARWRAQAVGVLGHLWTGRTAASATDYVHSMVQTVRDARPGVYWVPWTARSTSGACTMDDGRWSRWRGQRALVAPCCATSFGARDSAPQSKLCSMGPGLEVVCHGGERVTGAPSRGTNYSVPVLVNLQLMRATARHLHVRSLTKHV